MPPFELVVGRPEGVSERYVVSNEGIVLGRGDETTITLPSKHISRNHARFWVEEGVVRFEDLGSRNGIELNGERCDSGILAEWDRMVIGGTEIYIQRGTESSMGRAVISRERASALQQSIIQDAGDERLLVLYEAAKLLGEVFDLDELLHNILALIFKALPVERGYILTLRKADLQPEIHAARSSLGNDAGPPLSQTLIQHVFDRAEAILTMDAQSDSRFGHAESIMGHDIHAAMCAPLHGRAKVAGVIYVDVGNTSNPLKEADLELLSAIAQVVGVAVENARLYQENVERERLAAIGMATAGLGHCIKNILTGIRGGAQFVNMAIDRGDLGYLNRGWPILSRAIERIDMLVMNMLVISKDRKPDRQETDINALVRDVVSMFQERVNKYNVAIQTCLDPVGMANVDAHGIYRVLMNLVVNAVESCEHNEGSIEITTRCNEKGCTIRVHDTGIGIPEEIIPQLSQVFVSSKGSAGTGLGLACSYKIVREHGGDIAVSSTPGTGTVFTVFLPGVDGNLDDMRKTTIRRRVVVEEESE